MTLRVWSLVAALSAAACAAAPAPGARPARSGGAGPPRAPADGAARRAAQPFMPPAQAFLTGLMPLASSGVPAFLAANPSYDGRGVIIAILDSGIDPAAPGLVATSTGAPKLIDLRDFSGEGRVALVPATLDADGGLVLAGRTYEGAGRIHRIATAGVWYVGAVRELALGRAPASDINGNGSNTDVFPLVVVKAAEGWAAFLDTNLNGSFEDETPLHDYRYARETLALGTRPLTFAATFSESAGRPVLDLYFDTYGHGTHVAGIAAGHNLYDIVGFDGVAPGAQVIGLKIANNARGSITTHGSLARALAYAAQFAERRGMPLVLNLSFGIGNEREGRAVIDSLVNAFLAAHPAVVLAISAGNDGPGLSTLGFPGSADLALTVGATFPGPFTKPLAPGERPPPDGLGWWSGRGGDLAKPDLVAPGIAYSTVPRWETGQEVKLGTSMAAPHVAGLAACLLSAMMQEQRPASGVDVARALVASARPLPGGSLIDQGAGNPVLQGAYDWLVAGHQGSGYVVRAASGASAALRRDGLSGPGDTTEIFRVAHAAGRRAARYLLRGDVPWLVVPEALPARPGMTDIAVRYRADAFVTPGLYVGTVTALNPSDSLAGPLFRLINTVVVPIDLRGRSLQDTGRRVAPGRAQRYFLRVPTPQATLHVVVTVPDSAKESAIVKLFEPSGRPVRGVGDVMVGDEDGGIAEIIVPAQELVPGVYELNIIAPPLSPVTVDVQADMSPLALAFTGGAVEISNPGASSATAPLRVALVGAERGFDVAGRGAPAESLMVRVPDWAARAEIDFEMPVERWQDFTDFALTVFDSAGQVMEGTPLDYAVSRLAFNLDGARRGRPVTIELFPAYAWPDRTPPWRARVTVRFLAVAPDPIGGPREITVTAGGRLRAPLPVGRARAAPEGFVPVVEATVGAAVRRGTSEGGGR